MTSPDAAGAQPDAVEPRWRVVAPREFDAATEARVAELFGSLTSGIVVVDGPSGAGKTEFAAALAAWLAARGREPAVVHTDEYATWDDPVSWWPELEHDVLGPYAHGRDLEPRPRVWRGEAAVPGPPQLRRRRPLLLVEGVSSAREAITDRAAVALWIDGPTREERLERSVTREGEASRGRLAAWQDFEDAYFAVDGTRARCAAVEPRYR